MYNLSLGFEKLLNIDFLFIVDYRNFVLQVITLTLNQNWRTIVLYMYMPLYPFSCPRQHKWNRDNPKYLFQKIKNVYYIRVAKNKCCKSYVAFSHKSYSVPISILFKYLIHQNRHWCVKQKNIYNKLNDKLKIISLKYRKCKKTGRSMASYC